MEMTVIAECALAADSGWRLMITADQAPGTVLRFDQNIVTLWCTLGLRIDIDSKKLRRKTAQLPSKLRPQTLNENF